MERVGNRLPDTAVLFVIALFAVWAVSALLGGLRVQVPAAGGPRALTVQNQLTGTGARRPSSSTIVPTFTGFAPLGVVLVAMLGVGVAEHVGFIGAGLRAMLAVTPRRLLTPMLLLVAVISHTAADAGYVLVIPLGGVDLPRRGTPSARRHRLRLRRRVGRLRGQLHPLGHRSAAPGLHADGGADPRSRSRR